MYGNLILSLFKQMAKYLRLNNIPKLLAVQNVPELNYLKK